MPFSQPKNQREKKVEQQKKDPVSFIEPEKPKWNLQNIILNPSVKSSIEEVIILLSKSRVIYEDWGFKNVDSNYRQFYALNFYGPPGTGKSITADAIADALGKGIIKVNYADIESKYVGETPKNIVKIFNKAQETDSVLFFDEADSILGKRLSNITSSTDTSVNLTRSVMLIELDKFEGVVIFATNFYKNYDKAFIRRIFSHIYFEKPDLESLHLIWSYYIPERFPLGEDVCLKALTEKSIGLTGADIKNIIFKAAIKALSLSKEIVEQELFISAIDEIRRASIDSKESQIEDSSMTSSKRLSKEEVAELGLEYNKES
jgi:SpoVK/Ycf46/Vps4 family AAA+-type ATPase